jgi:AcrR family transcriptional regulator
MENYTWLKHILEQDGEPMSDKQKAIIKAAVEMFSQKGYAATSTREIAQMAKVSEGSIFKQYPTKKHLMLYITERIINTSLLPLISNGLLELLSKPFDSREEFINAFLQNRINLMQEVVPLFKILFQEIPFQPEIRAMLIEQIKKMPFNEIAEKLQPEESDDFSKEDVMQIILTYVAGFFILRNIMMPELFAENRLQKDAKTLALFISRGFG